MMADEVSKVKQRAKGGGKGKQMRIVVAGNRQTRTASAGKGVVPGNSLKLRRFIQQLYSKGGSLL
jgi:hypothetical protein